VIWACSTGSYTKFMNLAAASRLTAPFGIIIVSAQRMPPDSGITKRTVGVVGLPSWATSPDQPMHAAKLPVRRGRRSSRCR
jgi:hypothetical protein